MLLFCMARDTPATPDNSAIIRRAERSDFTQCAATGVPIGYPLAGHRSRSVAGGRGLKSRRLRIKIDLFLFAATPYSFWFLKSDTAPAGGSPPKINSRPPCPLAGCSPPGGDVPLSYLADIKRSLDNMPYS